MLWARQVVQSTRTGGVPVDGAARLLRDVQRSKPGSRSTQQQRGPPTNGHAASSTRSCGCRVDERATLLEPGVSMAADGTAASWIWGSSSQQALAAVASSS